MKICSGLLRNTLGFHARNDQGAIQSAKKKFRGRSVVQASERLPPTVSSLPAPHSEYVLSESIQNMSVEVAFKGMECVHDVPYIHQGHVNMCSDACLEMIRRYKKIPTTIATQTNSKGVEFLAHNCRGVFQGLKSEERTEQVSSLGLSSIDIGEICTQEPFFLYDLSQSFKKAPVFSVTVEQPFPTMM